MISSSKTTDHNPNSKKISPAYQQEAQKSSEQQISENQILQMLHRKKMPLIEQRFQQRDKGLPMDEFVQVMLEHLQYDKKDIRMKERLTLALIDFFKEVDVNGDETMEWQEFSNHIIELGLLRNDRSFKNVIKSYFPSEKVHDREKHEQGVESLHYFERLKNVFLLEKDCSRFKVYNAASSSLLYEVNAHKGTILDVEYLQRQNLLATSSNDLTINFWDASSFTLKQIVSVPEIQLRISYADWTHADRQMLYTGGSDAIIHIYDAGTLKEKGTISGWNPFYKSDAQQQGHSAPIGDLLAVDSQQTLVSACLGGSICLWDANSNQLRKELRGHDKGVYSLAWCDWSPMNQCLLSAGLDHEAFVWNTYVKDKIFLLRGHNHPLVGVRTLPGTPQVVTADITGMVKVWDVRNFLCVQTFNAPVDQLSCFCLTYSTQPGQPVKKRIICGARKMHYFEYDEPRDQLLTDQKPCLAVVFNRTLLCFVTMHAECLKVWDAKTGRLSSVYRGLATPGCELTCMILDSRERKLFVGDSDGSIFTVNIKNGAKMKSFQKHTTPVTALGYWTSQQSLASDQRYSDLRRIISTCMHPEVFIHDQDAPEEAKSSCRYIIKQHKDACNSICVRQGSEVLATGSDDGQTIITNLVSYRHEVMPHLPYSAADQKAQNTGDQPPSHSPLHSPLNSTSQLTSRSVKHVLYLDPFEALMAVDVHGRATFYAVGQSKLKNKALFGKQYMTESMTNDLEPFPITAVRFDQQSRTLILGDQFGNIQCWDMTQFLETLLLTKADNKPITSKRRDHHQQKLSKKASKIEDLSNHVVENTATVSSNSSSFMITEMNSKSISKSNRTSLLTNQVENAFYEELITRNLRIKQAHSDGITCVELVNDNHAFITSSFDCCCYIWSIEDGVKIGSLLLGGDPKWGLRFDLQQKKAADNQQAHELLERLDRKKKLFYSDGLSRQEDIKEYESMKEGVIKGARDILDYQKKLYGPQDPIIDILGDTRKLQREFFDQEQQDTSLNLMSDLLASKKNFSKKY